ncbi:MAG TPA: hypothetical protein PKD24_09710 [Pyrinomonadaceae bacterium]|nr:hypothetical protein [Pyrinomonadaceae bacterium]
MRKLIGRTTKSLTIFFLVWFRKILYKEKFSCRLCNSGFYNKLQSKAGNAVNYFLADHLGSTNGLADATGSLTATTGYDAFGKQTGTIATRYGFTGRQISARSSRRAA